MVATPGQGLDSRAPGPVPSASRLPGSGCGCHGSPGATQGKGPGPARSAEEASSSSLRRAWPRCRAPGAGCGSARCGSARLCSARCSPRLNSASPSCHTPAPLSLSRLSERPGRRRRRFLLSLTQLRYFRGMLYNSPLQSGTRSPADPPLRSLVTPCDLLASGTCQE